MNMQRGGTFHLQNWQLIPGMGTDRMGEEETERRHFPKGTEPGLCHPPAMLCAAALTTGTHHLASPCGVRASLAENQPFRDEIPG